MPVLAQHHRPADLFDDLRGTDITDLLTIYSTLTSELASAF